MNCSLRPSDMDGADGSAAAVARAAGHLDQLVQADPQHPVWRERCSGAVADNEKAAGTQDTVAQLPHGLIEPCLVRHLPLLVDAKAILLLWREGDHPVCAHVLPRTR